MIEILQRMLQSQIVGKNSTKCELHCRRHGSLLQGKRNEHHTYLIEYKKGTYKAEALVDWIWETSHVL